MVKHFKIGYQEMYEVSLHNNWECAKIVEMKQLKAEVKRQMAITGDYKVTFSKHLMCVKLWYDARVITTGQTWLSTRGRGAP